MHRPPRRSARQFPPRMQDLGAIVLLTVLWLLYFWRALSMQVSLPEGDFSGQFVAFGAYQYERLVSGEIPLWNPYNYGGSPFIGDTQSAVFYPLRLVTILGSYLTGGWTYASLQFEATGHYWLAGLFMFFFVARATRSRVAGIASAIVFAYGGFLTGYPPLQLALLEAAVWLPLMLLGAYKASMGGSAWDFRWLSISALALGLSLLAGHPQTTLLSMYTLMAYIVFRARSQAIAWPLLVGGLIYVLVVGFALGAVQVLPGLEYTRLTIRTALTPDELAAGFPFADLVILILPNVVTRWSPLYSGIAALTLAVLAGTSSSSNKRFWGILALSALLISFGGQTVLYYLAKAGLPGYSWFRGQERLAYIVAVSISILAGYGIAQLQQSAAVSPTWKRGLNWAVVMVWLGAFQVMLVDGFFPKIDLFALKNGLVLLALLTTATCYMIVSAGKYAPSDWWAIGIIALLIFDAFSTSHHNNWEAIPASDRLAFTPLVEYDAVSSTDGRVDGQWGIGGNYASMLGLYDIRGISPLRLRALEAYQTTLPQYRMHELLAVKYVLTDWQELEVPSDIIAADTAATPPINLHQLVSPLPRAWLVSQVELVDDDDAAIARLQNPGFDPRQIVLLAEALPFQLQGSSSDTPGTVSIKRYEPEAIDLHVEAEDASILVVSEWDYPGWQARVDDMSVSIIRADGGLRAIPIQAGTHDVSFRYRPLSVFVGGILTSCAFVLLTVNLITLAGNKQKKGTPV